MQEPHLENIKFELILKIGDLSYFNDPVTDLDQGFDSIDKGEKRQWIEQLQMFVIQLTNFALPSGAGEFPGR